MLGAVLGVLLAIHPQALDAVLQLKTATSVGYGVPLVGGRVLTVAHLVDGTGPQGVSYVDSSGDRGVLKVLWLDKERDLALLQASNPFSVSLDFCKTRPEVGENVYWKIYLETPRDPSWSHGEILGYIHTGDMLMSGWFGPGTSGSGIITESGCVAGIAYAGVNYSLSSAFPPALAATPLTKLPAPPK